MTTMTRWWFVRHGPVPGYEGRLYPDDQVAADVGDRAAFAVLAGRLPAGAQWLTSGLRRAEQTAEAILAAGAEAAEMAVEPDLAEQEFGAWRGQSYDQIIEAARLAGDEVLLRRMMAAPARVRPPEGESFADLMARVGRLLQRRSAAAGGRDIVAVAHGGTVRAALAHALGLNADRGLAFAVDTLSTTRIDYVRTPLDGGTVTWRVVFHNLRPR